MPRPGVSLLQDGVVEPYENVSRWIFISGHRHPGRPLMLNDIRFNKMVRCGISVGSCVHSRRQFQPVTCSQPIIKPASLQWVRIVTPKPTSGSFLHTVSVSMVVLRLEMQHSFEWHKCRDYFCPHISIQLRRLTTSMIVGCETPNCFAKIRPFPKRYRFRICRTKEGDNFTQPLLFRVEIVGDTHRTLLGS